MAELVIGSSQPVNLTLGAIKEHDVRRLMRQPWNMIASDGAFADGSDASAGHPRGAGTFPRLLGHYARDEGVLSLEEAVRKITSLPADFHGIEDRGRLAAGMRADIAIFDPPRSSTGRTGTTPSASPRAWSTCWSTASRCCATAR